MTQPCGACGPTRSQLSMIRQVAAALNQGHNGMAQLYRTIAKDLGVEHHDYQAMLDEASRHEEMGKSSLTIVIPDGVEEEKSR